MANRKEQGKSILSSLWDDYDNNDIEARKKGEGWWWESWEGEWNKCFEIIINM